MTFFLYCIINKFISSQKRWNSIFYLFNSRKHLQQKDIIDLSNNYKIINIFKFQWVFIEYKMFAILWFFSVELWWWCNSSGKHIILILTCDEFSICNILSTLTYWSKVACKNISHLAIPVVSTIIQSHDSFFGIMRLKEVLNIF